MVQDYGGWVISREAKIDQRYTPPQELGLQVRARVAGNLMSAGISDRFLFRLYECKFS